MPDPMIREFSFGTVISGSLAVFLRNLIPFVFLALLLTLPGALYDWLLPPTLGEGVFSLRAAIGTIVDIVCSTLLTATLVYGTVQELRGRHASFGASIGHGFSVILPAVGVGLVAGIGIAIGTILLIVPGLILMTIWWVAVPATVVERPGVFASLARSVELTRGFRWPIFGIILLLFAVALGIGLFFGYVLLPALAVNESGYFVYLLLLWVILSAVGAFTSVLAGVGYFALRVQKEGADLDQIASVFD
jgi:hypothetical protein